MQRRMLTPDEEATRGAEVEVRREDQDKINKFSRLHQRELLLDEELVAKHKDKEDLEEVANELELVDEDELVPYMIGDSFYSLPSSKVQELLSSLNEKVDQEASDLQGKIGEIREEMQQLKVQLYARFGKSINLES